MPVNKPITPTPNPRPTVVLPLLIPISPQNARATMLTSNQVRSAVERRSRLSRQPPFAPWKQPCKYRPCAEGS